MLSVECIMCKSRFEKIIIIGCGTVAKDILSVVIENKNIYGYDILFISVEHNLSESNIMHLCRQNGVCFINESEKNALRQLLSDISNETLIISAGNYYIFPKEIISKKNIEIINYHYSLLPQHRGRNAPSWVIFNGEKSTGATWHYVTACIDEGDIIWQGICGVEDDIKAWQLSESINRIAVQGFREFFKDLLIKKQVVKKQDNSKGEIHLSTDIPANGYFALSDYPQYIYRLLRSLDFGVVHPLGYPRTILNNGSRVRIVKYRIISSQDVCKYIGKKGYVTLEVDKTRALLMKYDYDCSGGISNAACIVSGNSIDRIKKQFKYFSLKMVSGINSTELQMALESFNSSVLFLDNDVYNEIANELWSVRILRKVYVLDPDDDFPIEKNNPKTTKKLWNYVAKRAKERPEVEIEQSGWVSLLTEKAFSVYEMEEYVNNVVSKVSSFCYPDSTVLLEIGIGSGLICKSLHEIVKKYIGTDISDTSLEMTRMRFEDDGIKNVELICADAVGLEQLNLKNERISIVIMNSVAQYFPGYSYFIEVVRQIVDFISDEGIILIGDLMDVERKNEWIKELDRLGKEINGNDLWYSNDFLLSLPGYIKGISDIQISDKIGTISNELTRYRRDILIKINKKDYNTIGKQKEFIRV